MRLSDATTRLPGISRKDALAFRSFLRDPEHQLPPTPMAQVRILTALVFFHRTRPKPEPPSFNIKQLDAEVITAMATWFSSLDSLSVAAVHEFERGSSPLPCITEADFRAYEAYWADGTFDRVNQTSGARLFATIITLRVLSPEHHGDLLIPVPTQLLLPHAWHILKQVSRHFAELGWKVAHGDEGSHPLGLYLW